MFGKPYAITWRMNPRKVLRLNLKNAKVFSARPAAFPDAPRLGGC